MTNNDAVELADGRASLVVSPREGAAILRYDALRPGRAPTPLIKPSTGLLKFGSQLLVPWSNRISGGGFEFEGRFHAIEPNVEGEPFPLHGDGFQRPWRLTRRSGTEMELVLANGAIGPYRYHASVRYALEDGALAAVLTVENRAAICLPYGLGFHPWFPRSPHTLLQASARRVWLEDERHLPTAVVSLTSRADWDFSQAALLPDTWVNNAFEGWDGRASITQPDDAVTVTVDTSSTLNVFVLYSPARDAGFFCFEPVSHTVDAHHTGGLDPLEPGGSITAHMRLGWGEL
ncbi:aldose 1-epimerase [Mesorhizobium qingshengii]|uniref:Aldose 1-epimerase n=1 Tax=Mesorhizobium qingshengii TaxID=1165689 RepID=A0A1G5ZAJ3_9HYPH|nr:aldose 1-epimerase [Mesorhizobium qingshengii]SDA91988.1 aldose 1-epimerase [Mesorhizobium qingshengii]